MGACVAPKLQLLYEVRDTEKRDHVADNTANPNACLFAITQRLHASHLLAKPGHCLFSHAWQAALGGGCGGGGLVGGGGGGGGAGVIGGPGGGGPGGAGGVTRREP